MTTLNKARFKNLKQKLHYLQVINNLQYYRNPLVKKNCKEFYSTHNQPTTTVISALLSRSMLLSLVYLFEALIYI